MNPSYYYTFMNWFSQYVNYDTALIALGLFWLILAVLGMAFAVILFKMFLFNLIGEE